MAFFLDANLGLNGTMEAASKASKVCAGNGNYYGDKDDCARESGGLKHYNAIQSSLYRVTQCSCVLPKATPLFSFDFVNFFYSLNKKVSNLIRFLTTDANETIQTNKIVFVR